MENADVKGAVAWASVATMCVPALYLLSIGIYLITLYIAYHASFPALLVALIFPVLTQVYWVLMLWGVTGTPFHWFGILCYTWLALFALYHFAWMRAAEKPDQRNANCAT